MNEQDFSYCETTAQLLAEWRKELDLGSKGYQEGLCGLACGSEAWAKHVVTSTALAQQLANAVIARLLELSAAKEPQK